MVKCLLGCLVLGMVLLSFGCSNVTPLAPTDIGSVSGKVINAVSGKGVEGAEVKLSGQLGVYTTYTSSTGVFQFLGVKVGSYILTITREGYEGLDPVLKQVAGGPNDFGILYLTPTGPPPPPFY